MLPLSQNTCCNVYYNHTTAAGKVATINFTNCNYNYFMVLNQHLQVATVEQISANHNGLHISLNLKCHHVSGEGYIQVKYEVGQL